MSEQRALTVGTAGHIDHGKTALVKALTGTDTDRLPEERRRGMSIALGFAEVDLGRCRLSLVDVPGHERFVRTMIAGAAGVDLYLMAVAADDGVMPQTLEHAAVLEALGVEAGVVALTKCDLATTADRDRVARAARELLPGAPVVEVSAHFGTGLEELREALRDVATSLDQDAGMSRGERPVVLHVDRQFTAPGHGLVVTGTLWSGVVTRGARLTVLPDLHDVRVRGIEVHNRATDRAGAGQRVALNLTVSGNRRVGSGDAVVEPGAPVFATYRLDVALAPRAGLEQAQQVQVHLGTRHAPARLVPLGDGFAQLRLRRQLLAQGGDRVVLRRLSPQETVGGAVVIDPLAPRHGPGAATERLRLLTRADPPELVAAALSTGRPLPRRAERLAGEPVLAAALHRFPRRRWQAALDELAEASGAVVRGESLLRVPAARPVVNPSPPASSHPLAEPVLEQLRQGGFAPPAPAAIATALGAAAEDVTAALAALTEAGRAVRVKRGMHFEAGRFDAARGRAIESIERRGSLTIAELRDELAVSRKYAQALLEHLDATRRTFRDGDVHRLRSRPASPPRRASG